MDLTNPYQNIQYRVGATNKDLQRAIEAAVPAAVVQMKDQSNQFRGITEKETAKKIFDFLKTQVHYKVDGDNQKIKLPSALLREREGDCKSYALFTAAVLSNLKIPYKFCYASYNPFDRTPEHIYVVTNKGTIIDAVWGKFNSEKKASYKFYKPMNISYISGIRGHYKKHQNKIGKITTEGVFLKAIQTSTVPIAINNSISEKQRLIKIQIDRVNSYTGDPNLKSTLLNDFNLCLNQTDIKKINVILKRVLGYDVNSFIYNQNRLNKTFIPNNTIGGPICGIGSMGIGRTWADWAKAVNIYNGLSSGMVAEIWLKNTNPLFAGGRGILEDIISKNAGGLANFLFNLSPMNTGEINQTNLSLLKAQRDLLIKSLNEKYPLANQAQSNFSQATYQTVTDPKTGKSYQVLVSNDTNVAAKQKQLESWTKDFNSGVVELYKKYPFIIRGASTPAAQAKYREFELYWVKSLGGNPDDLNNAVKAGNSKTPVGKTFNYWLAKKYNGQDAGVGLLIRAITDALVTGSKFQLGDKDAFNITFYGVKQGANISDAAMSQYLKSVGIGLDPATLAATIAGYSAVVSASVSAVVGLYQQLKGAGIFGDSSNTLTQDQLNALQAQSASTSTGILSGGTGTYLLIGGGVLAAYYLMKK
jgi:uncharacterized protein YgfB (UPF0149 family)